MALHADENRLSFDIGGAIRAGGQYGLLSTTIITNATSNQDLQDDVDTQAGLSHGDNRPFSKRLNRAIQLGNNATFDLENADVTGATTVETLADLTQNTSATDFAMTHFID